ncbi:hypothetical protein AB0H77_18855 [Streptomyces sp. NPDC050844]|uniref:hypothetical protein n=1 Tax=Streptomyces sp. NPDC050844 TaxID=3155790 RepID=UPI0033C97D1E
MRQDEATLEPVPGEVPDPAYERLPLAAGGRGRIATGLLESAFRLENLVVSGPEQMRLDRAVEAGVPIGTLVQVRRDDLGIPLRRERFPVPVPVPVPVPDDVIGGDPQVILDDRHAAMEKHAPKHPGGVRLDCVAAPGVLELIAQPRRDQEGWVPWAPPAEISQWLHRLRVMTYTPGRGAWFSLSYVTAPGREPTIEYDYTTRPAFEVSYVAPRCWHDELRLLPRTPEATPDWLLGEAWRHHQLLADAFEVPRPLRLAREFDGVDSATGRPCTCRPVMGHRESGRVQYCLRNAPVAVEADDPDARHHTDGSGSGRGPWRATWSRAVSSRRWTRWTTSAASATCRPPSCPRTCGARRRHSSHSRPRPRRRRSRTRTAPSGRWPRSGSGCAPAPRTTGPWARTRSTSTPQAVRQRAGRCPTTG